MEESSEVFNKPEPKTEFEAPKGDRVELKRVNNEIIFPDGDSMGKDLKGNEVPVPNKIEIDDFTKKVEYKGAKEMLNDEDNLAKHEDEERADNPQLP